MYKYIKFIKRGKKYLLWNNTYGINVGKIRKERFGTWMHWQLFSDDHTIGFTNGCLKEISAFITLLYRKDRGLKL